MGVEGAAGTEGAAEDPEKVEAGTAVGICLIFLRIAFNLCSRLRKLFLIR
jgi:hypothetical protein